MFCKEVVFLFKNQTTFVRNLNSGNYSRRLHPVCINRSFHFPQASVHLLPVQQTMGAAASLSTDVTINVDNAKEIAGDKWTPEIEALIAAKVAETGPISLIDARCIAPQLFYGDTLSLEVAKSHALSKGAEWNDSLDALFEENATAPSDGAAKLISTENWKALVPTMFETNAERAQRLQKEYLAILAARSEGEVVINYQMYNEKFPVSGNSLTAARIDEDYGLTDVMPGCRIRLSAIESKARTLYSNAHDGREAPWVREEPVGTFRELLAGETYYCIVFEDAAQYAKDMEALQQRLEADGVPKEDSKGRAEGCSCLFGNPCVDQYICKNWDNRFAVAKQNGWKGF